MVCEREGIALTASGLGDEIASNAAARAVNHRHRDGHRSGRIQSRRCRSAWRGHAHGSVHARDAV
ncbi:MAG: hypothetical protein MZU79_01015 [Anaerotruncus sp.]|nr:hypothetical protein [Anaerotruncus sp.]